ncbi:MAG TPA: tetratricopeptide repeat protein [Burkholderiales bacterium]|nr:tetratricopeptide repeat protein [Burkholderiales bacterium]
MLSSGWEALERDQFADAEALARQALQRAPADSEAWYLLGSALLFQERFQEALGPLSEAAKSLRRRGVRHRLGYCFLAVGDLAAAETALREEVRDHPEVVNAHNALGVALARQGKHAEALAVFQAVLLREPDSEEANNNVANVLSELGRDEEALPYLQSVVRINPRHADAQYNLGTVLQSLGRHEEAIDAFESALRGAPGNSYALGYLAWNELAICRWRELPARIEALRRQIGEKAAAAPFVVVALPVTLAEQRVCAELHVRHTLSQARAPLWQGTRQRRGRLRLAYLSADFHEHATAYLAVRLFELHDRSQFETLAVSYGKPEASPMRRRLEHAFDAFIDVRTRSDREIAELLREREIDVAVDLKGHTTGARLGILAYRPAPVQVTYLGFPGTTGAAFIDYVLADRFVIPEAEHGAYTEKVAYLPDCYQVNDSTRTIATGQTDRAALGLPLRAFVFCCFNNSYKIRPAVFAVWMRLLAAVPDSVLWLLVDNASAARNLRDAAASAGIDAQRLVFAPRAPHGEHLARQRMADLFLDTVPYNAHTTASDALWAGLPVLTVAGSTFAGRVAGSLLQAIGLPELVCTSLEEYERLALRLARDGALLGDYKRRLRENRDIFPLFDTDRFRRHIESAYRTMWERQEKALPPMSFRVTEI